MDFLNKNSSFPNPRFADDEGLVAVGGDLSANRLLEAYQKGIFPWYEVGQPILWWSPNPRMILYLNSFKISKSFSKTLQNHTYTLTKNSSFKEVIQHCAHIVRKGQLGTWITPEMQDAYIQLHRIGIAESVEVWDDNILIGGLYGINLKEKKIFCGESMFSLKSNASKIAMHFLVHYLQDQNYRFIDCQMHTPHLESLGAQEIPRDQFLEALDSQ